MNPLSCTMVHAAPWSADVRDCAIRSPRKPAPRRPTSCVRVQLGVPAGVLRRRLDTETIVRDDPAAFIRAGYATTPREQLLAALAP